MNFHHKTNILTTFLMYTSALVLLFILASPAHAKDVTFAWSANTEPITGYKLYYKTGGDASGPFDGTGLIEGNSPILIDNVTTITVTGLSDTETYHFALTAYNDEDESVFSEIVTVMQDPVPVILNIIKQ